MRKDVALRTAALPGAAVRRGIAQEAPNEAVARARSRAVEAAAEAARLHDGRTDDRHPEALHRKREIRKDRDREALHRIAVRPAALSAMARHLPISAPDPHRRKEEVDRVPRVRNDINKRLFSAKSPMRKYVPVREYM